MTPALTYAEQHADQFKQELIDFLKIPSVSTDASYAEEVQRAATWLADHMREIGLTVEIIETDGRHPLVYAEHIVSEDAKTVLFYGHYDVQPAAIEDGWDSDPFDPVEKDGKLYARGATDDKGQMFIHVKAVEALLRSDDALPVNVKFIIEGEEESGSQAITAFVAEQGAKLAADVCVISDTSMSDIEQPVIINALRGVLAFELTVTGPGQDLHSGMYGGSVHNPLQALAEFIAKFHNDEGAVAVPGFYDDVRPLSDADREEIAALPWDNVTWSEDTGSPLPWGEDGYSLRERIGARPTLEVNGIAGGYYGKGLKAIIPHKAWAKISCRLVADQDPQDIMEKIQRYINKIKPPTVNVEITALGKGKEAALINTDTPAMQAAIVAYEKGWGAQPIFKREGGSIPIVSDFQNTLNLPVIMMGFGLDTDGLHGPNEHYRIEMFHKGIQTMIHFLQQMPTIT